MNILEHIGVREARGGSNKQPTVRPLQRTVTTFVLALSLLSSTAATIPASAADSVGTPKDTWTVTTGINYAAARLFPVPQTGAPLYTGITTGVTLPYTSPSTHTYFGSLRTGTESTLARSFTFSAPNDGCELSYSVSGTPALGEGYVIVAYNSRTSRAIPLKDYSTWGATWSAWNKTAGAVSPTRTLTSITSNFNAGNGGNLIWGFPSTTGASGDVTTSATLATVDAGNSPILSSDLTAGNIVIAIYYVDNNGTGTADTVKTISMTCAGGTTPATYTVTPASGTGGSATANDSNSDGTWDLVATADPGFVFSSWSCSPTQTVTTSASATATVTPTADTTCTANFTPYTVTPASGTGGTATANDSNSDGTWDLVATADPGFVFSSWSCSPTQTVTTSASATATVTPTADTTCTANFTTVSPTYTVTPASGAGGSATASDSNSDGTWDLVATADPGFVFSSWSCSPTQTVTTSTSATATVTPTANTTCTATFTAVSSIPMAIITHTDQTVSSVFIDGTATALTAGSYSVQTSKGRTTINGVNPGVLFYWAKFTSTGTGSQTLVTHTSTAGSAYFLQFVSSGSNIYRAGQTSVAKGYRMSWNASTGTLSVSGLAAGDYWIGIKFSASSLSGLTAPGSSSVTYGFSAGAVAGTSQSLSLNKKI